MKFRKIFLIFQILREINLGKFRPSKAVKMAIFDIARLPRLLSIFQKSSDRKNSKNSTLCMCSMSKWNTSHLTSHHKIITFIMYNNYNTNLIFLVYRDFLFCVCFLEKIKIETNRIENWRFCRPKWRSVCYLNLMMISRKKFCYMLNFSPSVDKW